MRGLEGEFVSRARRLGEAADKEITLSEHGKLWWDGAIVAKLAAGPSPLTPSVALVADELLKGAERETVQARLYAFLTARIEARIEPLLALARAAEAKAGSATALPSYARGLAHQLMENFGSLEREGLVLPEKLGPVLRALKPFGVWFGRRTVYLPRLLRPDAASLLGLFWGIWTRQENLVGPPPPGLTSFMRGAEPEGFLQACGFRVFAGRAIRLDILERLEEELDKAATEGASAEDSLPKLVSLLGAGNEDGKAVLAALGWRMVDVAGGAGVWRKAREKKRRPEPEKAPPPDSPFAALAQLVK